MIKAHSLFRRIWQKLGMSETVLPPVLVWLRLLLVQWPGHAMLRASDGCHLRLYDCAGLWTRIRRLWGLKRLRTAGRTAIRAGWATGFSRATEICFCTFVQLQSPIWGWCWRLWRAWLKFPTETVRNRTLTDFCSRAICSPCLCEIQMLQLLQSQADADDDPAAQEARAEKEEAPGWSCMCIGALVHCTSGTWGTNPLGPVAGCKVLNETMGKAKQARQVLQGNLATAILFFSLWGICKVVSALKVLDVLKRLGQDHQF